MRWQDTCCTFWERELQILWPCQPLHTFDFLFFLKVWEKPRRNPPKKGCDPLSRFSKQHLSSFSSLIALALNFGIFSSRFFCHCLPLPAKEAEGALVLIKEKFACSFSQSKLVDVYCTLSSNNTLTYTCAWGITLAYYPKMNKINCFPGGLYAWRSFWLVFLKKNLSMNCF